MHTIIVGAGSAGSALAARLSEDPEHDVLLLEAGPDYPNEEDVPHSILDAYDIAEDHDWGLSAYFVEPPDERAAMWYPRGRVVGGSSCVNASIAQRGAPEDFEHWSALGNDEWAWDRVERFYARLERDLDYGEAPYHGVDGPVPIYRVARERWPAAVSAFERACLDRGYAPCLDANAPGGTGVGPLPRNQIGDKRASGLLTYLAEARGRANLTIDAGVTVTRILLDGRRAVGVEVERDGRREQVTGDRVVLCAGAIFSPHLLMLSGIGPAATLREFDIEPVVARDGVGQSLRDHPFLVVMGLLEHREEGKPFGVLNALRITSEPGDFNDVMLFSPILEPSALNLGLDLGDRKAMGVLSLLAKPRSVGWLTLASDDPAIAPELHMNYLSDPLDMSRMKKAVRLSWDIATSPPVAEELSEVLFPDAETISDDRRLEAWMLETVSTAYHAAGTCRMGPAADPGAVVSQRLAVHGIDGLWVADASVMPNITAGLTNLTAYMIGERMAAWMRGDPTLGGGAAAAQQPA